MDALFAQDDTLTLGMSFEQRIQLAVDEAHTVFTHEKSSAEYTAQLRYSNADLRRLDMFEERGLNLEVIAQLATCSVIDRPHNVVFQVFTGSGKSYPGSSLLVGQTGLHDAHPCPFRQDAGFGTSLNQRR